MDIAQEPQHILDLYGARPGFVPESDAAADPRVAYKGTDAAFANNCLLARRLIEAGVRFVQIYDWGWDHHGVSPGEDIPNTLPIKVQQVDRALSGLVRDLKQRGLFDETLIVWGGEFGRTPMAQNSPSQPFIGRDHHPYAFTVLLAGGGIQGRPDVRPDRRHRLLHHREPDGRPRPPGPGAPPAGSRSLEADLQLPGPAATAHRGRGEGQGSQGAARLSAAPRAFDRRSDRCRCDSFFDRSLAGGVFARSRSACCSWRSRPVRPGQTSSPGPIPGSPSGMDCSSGSTPAASPPPAPPAAWPRVHREPRSSPSWMAQGSAIISCRDAGSASLDGSRRADCAVLRFDGRDDDLERTGLDLKLDAVSVFLVAAPASNLGGFRGLLAGNQAGVNDYTSGFTIDLGPSPSPRLDFLNVEGKGFGGAANLLKEPRPFGQFHLFQVIIPPGGGTISSFVDDIAQATRPRQPATMVIDELSLGARCYSNEPSPVHVQGFFHGDIAEVLVYGRGVSEAERKSIAGYLAAKHRGLSEAIKDVGEVEGRTRPPHRRRPSSASDARPGVRRPRAAGFAVEHQ